MRWFPTLIAAAAVAGLLGCGGGSAAAMRPSVPSDSSVATVTAGELTGAEALRRLPASTAVVVVSPRGGELASQLGLDGWVREQLGRSLGGAGLDPAGPAGIAWLEPESRTAAVFATVADEAKLREAMQARVQALGRELRARRAGEATWLGSEGEGPALVVRGGQAFWVTSGAASRRDHFAMQLAAAEPDRSLANRADVAAASDALGGEAHLLAYVDGGALAPESALGSAVGAAGVAALAGVWADDGTLRLRGGFAPGHAGARRLLAADGVHRILGAGARAPLAFGLHAEPALVAELLGRWLGEAPPAALLDGELGVAFAEHGVEAIVGAADPEGAREHAAGRLDSLPLESLPDAVGMSQDPGFAERVARGAESAADHPIDSLLGRRAAGVLRVDGALLAHLILGDIAEPPDIAFFGADDGDGDYPASDRYREIERELGALQERYLAAVRQLDRLRADRPMEVGRPLGTLAAIALRDGDAVRIEGLLAPAEGTAAEALSAAIEAAGRYRSRIHELGREVAEVAAAHERARHELIRVRLQDIKRHQQSSD